MLERKILFNGRIIIKFLEVKEVKNLPRRVLTEKVTREEIKLHQGLGGVHWENIDIRGDFLLPSETFSAPIFGTRNKNEIKRHKNMKKSESENENN